MSVTRIIPAKIDTSHKLKVAAYCRVSTKMAEQQSSLVAQELYYEDYIKQNSKWTFVGVYSDIGSGTRIKGLKHYYLLVNAAKST